MRSDAYLESLSRRYRFSKDVLRALQRSVDDLEALLDSLRKPPSRYYLRVNTLKASRERVLELAEEEGIRLHPDERFEDLVYAEVKGPFKLRDLPPKVVVADKHAAESVMMGAHLYLPGIIRLPKVRKGELVRITDKFGQVVAIGKAEMDYREMLRLKKGLAFRNVASPFRCPSLRETELYRKGLVYSQSLPAYLTSLVLAPTSTEVVVDLCAAPGGKTTHMAQLMGNAGKIFAFDRPSKIPLLLENLRRLGVRIVEARGADSRYLHIDFPHIKADKILLDPPCSDLGVRPKLFEEKTARELASYPEYQKQFVKAAYEVLKPGGVLVYSTCTLTKEENEEVIEYAEEMGFEVLPPECPLGERKRYGIYFYPHVHDTTGYFIAKLRKPASP